jgi:plasmid stabilization system protein ParE
VVTPRLVFYKVVGREVRIYRVLHARRVYEDIL